MRHFRGLTLTTASGLAWRWTGCTVVHVRGRDVRMEKWQAQCPHCGETVTVRARLAGGLRRQFYDRRYNAAPSEIVEVRLALPGKHAPVAFEIRNCNHRRRTAAAESPQLVAG
jgi:hypothetical protein